jgi:hypothetical protein
MNDDAFEIMSIALPALGVTYAAAAVWGVARIITRQSTDSRTG